MFEKIVSEIMAVDWTGYVLILWVSVSVIAILTVIGGLYSVREKAHGIYTKRLLRKVGAMSYIGKKVRPFVIGEILLCVIPVWNIIELVDFVIRYDDLEKTYLQVCARIIQNEGAKEEAKRQISILRYHRGRAGKEQA